MTHAPLTATATAPVARPTRYCRSCDYVLDGLPSPRCPECGTGFDPADHRTFRSESRSENRDRWNRRVVLIAVCLFVLELACVALAYETIGGVYALAMGFIVVFTNAVAIGTLVFRRPKFTFVLLLLIAGMIIPDQLRLGIRLALLTTEAHSIRRYVESVKVASGDYPPNLAGYTFHHGGLAGHFSYGRSTQNGGYMLRWYVGTPSTSHWYSPRTGWGYYPD